MKPPASPAVADIVDESESFICSMLFYGPPVLFFVVPWLLLGLILMGPFLALLTLVAALLAAAVLLAALGAIVAAPVLMLRNRRAVPAAP